MNGIKRYVNVSVFLEGECWLKRKANLRLNFYNLIFRGGIERIELLKEDEREC